MSVWGHEALKAETKESEKGILQEMVYSQKALTSTFPCIFLEKEHKFPTLWKHTFSR